VFAENWRSYLDIARQAATLAAESIAVYQPDNTQVQFKADDSPVTLADQQAEQVLRKQLESAFPQHAIWGEEYGHDPSVNSDYLWLLDPIDGTKSWIGGLPFWSIQIGLQQHQQMVLGVSYAPALQELAWTVKGQGAWLNDQAIRTSDVVAIEQCRLSSGNLGSLSADKNRWAAYGGLLTRCNRTRGYGDYYHYHRLAAGQLDVVIESDVNILDISALSLLVDEAGGKMTDLTGAPIGLQTTSVLAAANAELHSKILAQLNTHA